VRAEDRHHRAVIHGVDASGRGPSRVMPAAARAQAVSRAGGMILNVRRVRADTGHEGGPSRIIAGRRLPRGPPPRPITPRGGLLLPGAPSCLAEPGRGSLWSRG
jgi:hypothetical protein